MSVQPPGSNPYPSPDAGRSADQPGSSSVIYLPRMRKLRSRWLIISVAVVVLIAIVVIVAGLISVRSQNGPGGLLLAVGVVVLFVAVVLAVYFLHVRSLSVTIDSSDVTRRALGRSRRVPRDVLQRVITASYTQRDDEGHTSREVPLAAFLDSTGRSRLTLSLVAWDVADVRAMASQLGLTDRMTTLGSRTIRQLRKEVPGALPWRLEHRVWSTLIGILIALVVAAVAAIVGLGIAAIR